VVFFDLAPGTAPLHAHKKGGKNNLPTLREFVFSARYFFNANIPGPTFFTPGMV
jgi:hypothetical protein